VFHKIIKRERGGNERSVKNKFISSAPQIKRDKFSLFEGERR
jgi:hypothetical protein